MNKKGLLAIIVSIFISVTSLPVHTFADWVKEDGKTYYLDESGDKLTGWQTIDGKKFYFLSDGEMKTGWTTMKSGKKYYFKKDGSMVTGWLKSGENKYYFNKNGVMVTGNVKIGKKIYCFNEDGVLEYQCKNMFVYVGEKLYSLDKNGAFCTGMETVDFPNGKSVAYYFGENGYAITTTKVIDGVTYEFDAQDGLIDSYINIKVGTFKSDYLQMSNFKIKNEKTYSSNKVVYSGSIKNKYSKAVDFYIYASFYDKDGNLIDNRQIISCDNVKPGETYKFNNYKYVDDTVYRIEFTEINVYRS